jgi:hypothetical protein
MSMTDLLIRSRVEKTTCPPGTAFSKDEEIEAISAYIRVTVDK